MKSKETKIGQAGAQCHFIPIHLLHCTPPDKGSKYKVWT